MDHTAAPRPDALKKRRALSCGRETIRIEELAAHVAEISEELARLADRARWPQLALLLKMTRVEAQARLVDIRSRQRPPAAK